MTMKMKISVITIIFATFLAVRSEEERYFSRSPKNVDVVAGRNVTLPCEVTPARNIKYYWELNGHTVSNTTRRFQQGSDLVITRADRERDSGHFTCIAHDQKTGLSITSSEAALNIHWIGEALVQLQAPESASYITPGSDVTLRCHLDASGDIRYEWFRNADRLTKNARLDLKKKRLHIKSVNPSDNGVYRCSAFNEAGSVHSVKNFALAVPGDQTALIQTVPINQLVKKGSSAQFDCVYQHSNVLEWYFKNRPVESNDRISVLSNGTLQISVVRESDQGIYNCVGIRAESTEVPQSYIAELKVAFLENLKVTSFEPPLPDEQIRIVSEGSLFQQTCLHPYSLPPARQWWLNPAGHTISDTGSTRVDDGRLIIEKTESKNAGIYACVAENMAGKTEMVVTVIVTTKPEITLDPESVTVDENRKSVLTCEFDAMEEPYTTVRWRKDGKILRTDQESGNGHHKIKTYGNSSSLIIQTTKISDRGEYKCEVQTAGFESIVSKPATISVIEILKFSPPPVSKNLELGSIAKVHCKAQGTPPPLVHWERLPNFGEGFASHITDMNGTLHFNGVLSEDKGKYICYASNSQGTINTTVNIEIVVAPKFITFPKNSVEAIEGYSVMLDCVVEGDPKPMIQWDKNSRMNDFDNTRFKVLENGTLFISEVYRDDDNKYGCTAGNSAGLNRKEIRLVVHSGEGYRPNENSEDLENEGAMITKAVLITMSVAGAYMILVIGLMVWCRYRRKARKLAVNAEAGKTEPVDTDNTELKDNVNGHIAGPSKPTENGVDAIHKEGQKSDGGDTAHSHSSGHSKKSKSSYDKISLSRQLLKDIKQIGRGEFGDVMIAKMSVSTADKRSSTATTPTGPSEEKEIPVLVKSLTQTKDDESLAEFKRELDLFHKINHENISKLLGMCREVEPHYLILEHTDWGDLKQFLLATQKDGPTPELTIAQAVAVVHQLSRGMEHLSNNRLVHKDLAARNCVITSTLGAKISMPRLIKEPYSQEYCKHMNQLIPLRWLPHEAVYEDEYSTKSDVYSLGVVIWEIFSKGELPLSKMSDNTLLTQLKEKQVQWKPHKATPPELQKLEETCWAQSPKDRPYFTEIVQTVSEILKSL